MGVILIKNSVVLYEYGLSKGMKRGRTNLQGSSSVV